MISAQSFNNSEAEEIESEDGTANLSPPSSKVKTEKAI